MNTTEITLILTALATGAAAGLKDAASQAVTDAYHGLKERLQQKFANQPTALAALTKHEQTPEVWKASLAEALKATGADQDQDIITAAQQVLILRQSQENLIGHTIVQNTGPVQGQVLENSGTITMHFGEMPKA